jgi:hypothetical protein
VWHGLGLFWLSLSFLALALALALTFADCTKRKRDDGPKHVEDFRNSLAATPVSGEKIDHSISLPSFLTP